MPNFHKSANLRANKDGSHPTFTASIRLWIRRRLTHLQHIAIILCLMALHIEANAQQWIDLSHSFDNVTIYWPTAEGFELDIVAQGQTKGGYYYSANKFMSSEHGGTHLDAPIHFAKGKHSVEQIPLSRLIGAASVIDVSTKALRNPDYQITIRDIKDWEAIHGKLADDIILLFNTGYARYWPDRKKYMGTDKRGKEAVALLHFPGIHPETAQWLITHRKIAAIGLDTPSLDYGQTKRFLTHRLLAKEQIPGFENVTNLDKLPPTGSQVIALPMKIKGGSGGPLRIVARIDVDMP